MRQEKNTGDEVPLGFKAPRAEFSQLLFEYLNVFQTLVTEIPVNQKPRDVY